MSTQHELFAQEPTRNIFIGLMPDAAVQAAMVQQCQRWRWPVCKRLTPTHRLHMTLHPMGEIDAPREQALRRALREVSMAPLDLVLRIPEQWTGGIAVLRPEACAALDALHDRVGKAMWSAGIQAERGFISSSHQ